MQTHSAQIIQFDVARQARGLDPVKTRFRIGDVVEFRMLTTDKGRSGVIAKIDPPVLFVMVAGMLICARADQLAHAPSHDPTTDPAA